MKIYTKLFIAGAILLVIPGGLTALFSFFCFSAGLILLICKNITEITNKNSAEKKNYTYSYDSKKENKPPWEE